MRWAPLVALSLTTGQVEAGPARSAPHEDLADSVLWRDAIEPHGVEVDGLLSRARAALGKLSESPDGGMADRRMRAANDAYRALRHARKLSPDNAEVLLLLGYVADEIGNTRQAIDALESCIRLQGPERAGSEVTGRLGTIYLRLGNLDEAIRWLRHAQGPIALGSNAVSAVHLATALAARGQTADAIDVLANALPEQTSYFTDAVTLVSFALAVTYDRDEQRGAAFDVLDRMQATLQQELGPFVQRALADLRFAPPEDEYYYRALLYEALGAYTEARAEWALYTAVPDAAWRHRALEHLRALEPRRAASLAAPPTPSPSKLPVP